MEMVYKINRGNIGIYTHDDYPVKETINLELIDTVIRHPLSRSNYYHLEFIYKSGRHHTILYTNKEKRDRDFDQTCFCLRAIRMGEEIGAADE